MFVLLEKWALCAFLGNLLDCSLEIGKSLSESALSFQGMPNVVEKFCIAVVDFEPRAEDLVFVLPVLVSRVSLAAVWQK